MPSSSAVRSSPSAIELPASLRQGTLVLGDPSAGVSSVQSGGDGSNSVPEDRRQREEARRKRLADLSRARDTIRRQKEDEILARAGPPPSEEEEEQEDAVMEEAPADQQERASTAGPSQEAFRKLVRGGYYFGATLTEQKFPVHMHGLSDAVKNDDLVREALNDVADSYNEYKQYCSPTTVLLGATAIAVAGTYYGNAERIQAHDEQKRTVAEAARPETELTATRHTTTAVVASDTIMEEVMDSGQSAGGGGLFGKYG